MPLRIYWGWFLCGSRQILDMRERERGWEPSRVGTRCEIHADSNRDHGMRMVSLRQSTEINNEREFNPWANGPRCRCKFNPCGPKRVPWPNPVGTNYTGQSLFWVGSGGHVTPLCRWLDANLMFISNTKGWYLKLSVRTKGREWCLSSLSFLELGYHDPKYGTNHGTAHQM